MLINQKQTEVTPHVEFVEYTGKYPNLCDGILTLKIDGQIQKFGHRQEHSKFWVPGGDNVNGCFFKGEWAIDVEEIPEEFRKYAAEIDNVFNTNVEQGHCGGCR